MAAPQNFTLHEVAAGVWAAEADFTGLAIGNAAIVDAGGKTIVVDTFMTDTAAMELRAVAEQVTGNSVHLVVNSHWHGDHTNGNQVFGDLPIAATHLTLERIAVESSAAEIEAWSADLDQAVEELESAGEDDAGTAQRLQTMRQFRRFADDFSLTLPDLLIERTLTVQGERSVEISTLGKGHTISDVFVWVPDVSALITGDLCWNGIHPRTNDGFPEEWAEYVESLARLGPKHVVPGHGPPGDGTALSGLPDYFRALPAMVDQVREGTDPREFTAPGASGDWEGLARFHAGLEALAAH